MEIKTLFANDKDIYRTIEKVITYGVSQEQRLKAEISEYVVTESIEEQFEKLLSKMQAAMEAGGENEVGVWVSGFYGSGKSSFTKYLGLAFDDTIKLDGTPFIQHLQDRLKKSTTKALLNTVAKRFPAAVVMLDLASTQLAEASMKEVSTVLYYKILEWAGYSQNLKVAAFERRLKKEGRYTEFQQVFSDHLGGEQWQNYRNDPLVVDSVIPEIAHQMYPQFFKTPSSFSTVTEDWIVFTDNQVEEMLEIAREATGKEYIIFIVDEVGQYVGSRQNLILNLDGLAKNLKNIGNGYEVGYVKSVPLPSFADLDGHGLAELAREAWSLKRTLDTVNENSHAFLLPEALRPQLGDFNPQAMSDRMAIIQEEIDWRCFQLYGFSPEDQNAALQQTSSNQTVKLTAGDDEDDEAQASAIDRTDGLLSWAAGVAFGRFDWRLASGERAMPAEPEPFDPLPAQSHGMLPPDSPPFHTHQGILLDEAGHMHDLAALIGRVLHTVDALVEMDVRRWLTKDFFPLHLKLYSKSRRQAPIYWPLQTPSGSYTLWVYYHSLSGQTLYSCVNDFVEPKLKTVSDDLTALRNKTRSSQEEKEFANLTDLEAELKNFRDELLRIAKFWKPNLNDGVQITAAPLWKLFQHKPWQKKLKETWESLEQGEYDWAHLAYSIWPERVLRKCHQDRSLAIAHDVEADFWHQVEVKTKRGKKGSGETKLEWQPIPMTDAQLHALIRAKIAGMM